jgi:hypothetical protein
MAALMDKSGIKERIGHFKRKWTLRLQSEPPISINARLHPPNSHAVESLITGTIDHFSVGQCKASLDETHNDMN